MRAMNRTIFICLAAAILMVVFMANDAYSEDYSKIPEKGKITLIDLGAATCIPCKMMAPVLEKVKKRFSGKAEVIVIDIRYDRDQAQRFQLRAIPTQIFFDKEGKEVYRHLGFLDENAIVEQFTKMGVK
jgi:thioredoxin 1